MLSVIAVVILQVLFPLLSKLLEHINSKDPSGVEETRMRASTLLCKVRLELITSVCMQSSVWHVFLSGKLWSSWWHEKVIYINVVVII